MAEQLLTQADLDSQIGAALRETRAEGEREIAALQAQLAELEGRAVSEDPALAEARRQIAEAEAVIAQAHARTAEAHAAALRHQLVAELGGDLPPIMRRAVTGDTAEEVAASVAELREQWDRLQDQVRAGELPMPETAPAPAATKPPVRKRRLPFRRGTR